MALNSLICADVPLRSCSLTHSDFIILAPPSLEHWQRHSVLALCFCDYVYLSLLARYPVNRLGNFIKFTTSVQFGTKMN